jgi:hypothetical protein
MKNNGIKPKNRGTSFAAAFCYVFALVLVLPASAQATCEAERDARERTEERKDAAERATERAELSSIRAQAKLDLCLNESRRGEAACRPYSTVREAEQRFVARERERAARRVKYLQVADAELTACIRKQTGAR